MSGGWSCDGIRAYLNKFAAPGGTVWRKSVTTVGTRFPPESRVTPPVESIAGERTGAFVAPVLSQLPAVRAVAGF